MRRLALLLIGLGVGLFAGSQLSASRAQATALWTGVAATVVGLVMLAAAPSEPYEEPAEGDERRPALSGLGTRVEGVLKLAEQQAADHLREAERDAKKVRARVEAGLWAVLREGDDGQRYEVARLESRSDADSVVAALEARGHLQRYTVAPAGS
ncbi:hypothetical protein [Dactylosporangium matsuzakiense]|uniref:SPOR domain-containing protein n=1 Tax=Dactylosporangium matsuzakiense TaxID=53360 RepID=A0A9W6KU13_9ACTN|nr:hypothetical protein [Dactylosporangium matsuzakiense]UWZ46412.1 hypothetical protein Dmats_08300 [Dactylosporangium matsuzakiense]GLL07185.1 hypothetical protein GCM10017581_089370 [Dactylosporangium matsuzakiense]